MSNRVELLIGLENGRRQQGFGVFELFLELFDCFVLFFNFDGQRLNFLLDIALFGSQLEQQILAIEPELIPF